MQRKKINPSKFIEDLRSGMTPEELMGVHGLTGKGLDQILRALVSRNLIEQTEADSISPNKPENSKTPAKEEHTENIPKQRPPSKIGSETVFLGLWVLGFFSLALVAGYLIFHEIAEEKRKAEQRHRARVTWGVSEAGRTAPAMTPPPGHENDTPIQVVTGVYVDRIIEVEMPDSRWTVDFYIWFNWQDEGIDPGSTFQVVEGKITDKRELENTRSERGFYQLYRVTAEITKHFNTSRFPCDDHLMTIRIEDRVLQSYQLKFIADKKGSAVSSRVKIPGYEIHKTSMIAKPHSYKTRRGNLNLPEDFKTTYSQLVYGLWIRRPGFGFFFKLFQGTFAAVAIALVAFFIKPTSLDPRFGLSVGAFFAAVANNYIASSLLPDTGIMTLADIVNAIGMVTIFFTILQSAISLYVYDIMGNQSLSIKFDRISFFVFVIAYTGINIVIPMAATY